eukprot:TRINITY_DN14460_c0_g2_i1.p1 TRINITY_DN14460_c0_g2~~TRINITY_DN14460_c0_g2_i1.p1  ORF type:complete len:1397 (+),score=186.30 TRINITY_DN14460_c0_g2_i1:82-4272(+)
MAAPSGTAAKQQYVIHVQCNVTKKTYKLVLQGEREKLQVRRIKKHLVKYTNVPEPEQILSFGGRTLLDDETGKDIGLQDRAILQLDTKETLQARNEGQSNSRPIAPRPSVGMAGAPAPAPLTPAVPADGDLLSEASRISEARPAETVIRQPSTRRASQNNGIAPPMIAPSAPAQPAATVQPIAPAPKLQPPPPPAPRTSFRPQQAPSSSAAGLLSVRVHHALELPPDSAARGNFTVGLRLNEGPWEFTEARRGTNPQYEESRNFPLAQGGSNTLEIMVTDREQAGRPGEVIGQATVPLDTLPQSEPTAMTIPLMIPDERSPAGWSFPPSHSCVVITCTKESPVSVSSAFSHSQAPALGSARLLSSPLQAQPPQSQKPVVHPDEPHVVLRVHGASDLVASDPIGKCDPYVGVRANSGPWQFTSVKQGTTPTFEEEFVVPLSPASGTNVVEIAVMDKDRIGKDDVLGQAAIEVDHLPRDWPTRMAINLLIRDPHTGDWANPRGRQSSVSITCTPRNFGSAARPPQPPQQQQQQPPPPPPPTHSQPSVQFHETRQNFATSSTAYPPPASTNPRRNSVGASTPSLAPLHPPPTGFSPAAPSTGSIQHVSPIHPATPHVVAVVHRASDLPDRDSFGPSEYYVGLRCNNGPWVYTTVKEGGNPVFEQEFQVTLGDPVDGMRGIFEAKVQTKGFGKDDVMGQASFQLEVLQNDQSLPLSLPLQRRDPRAPSGWAAANGAVLWLTCTARNLAVAPSSARVPSSPAPHDNFGYQNQLPYGQNQQNPGMRQAQQLSAPPDQGKPGPHVVVRVHRAVDIPPARGDICVGVCGNGRTWVYTSAKQSSPSPEYEEEFTLLVDPRGNGLLECKVLGGNDMLGQACVQIDSLPTDQPTTLSLPLMVRDPASASGWAAPRGRNSNVIVTCIAQGCGRRGAAAPPRTVASPARGPARDGDLDRLEISRIQHEEEITRIEREQEVVLRRQRDELAALHEERMRIEQEKQALIKKQDELAARAQIHLEQVKINHEGSLGRLQQYGKELDNIRQETERIHRQIMEQEQMKLMRQHSERQKQIESVRVENERIQRELQAALEREWGEVQSRNQNYEGNQYRGPNAGRPGSAVSDPVEEARHDEQLRFESARRLYLEKELDHLRRLQTELRSFVNSSPRASPVRQAHSVAQQPGYRASPTRISSYGDRSGSPFAPSRGPWDTSQGPPTPSRMSPVRRDEFATPDPLRGRRTPSRAGRETEPGLPPMRSAHIPPASMDYGLAPVADEPLNIDTDIYTRTTRITASPLVSGGASRIMSPPRASQYGNPTGTQPGHPFPSPLTPPASSVPLVIKAVPKAPGAGAGPLAGGAPPPVVAQAGRPTPLRQQSGLAWDAYNQAYQPPSPAEVIVDEGGYEWNYGG